MLTCAGLVLNGITSASSGKMHIHLHKTRSPESWSHLHGLLLPINNDKLLMQWSPHTSIRVSIFTRTQSSSPLGSSLTHFCILSRWRWLHVIPQGTSVGNTSTGLSFKRQQAGLLLWVIYSSLSLSGFKLSAMFPMKCYWSNYIFPLLQVNLQVNCELRVNSYISKSKESLHTFNFLR